MTLERAIVRLTRAAASPGVAFVALSRVRHPDHLMLEDTFPDLATIMRQSDKESFQARQRWERRMRAHFSRTVRAHMQDAEMYSAEKVWDSAENEVAELLLAAMRRGTEAGKEEVVRRCMEMGIPHEEACACMSGRSYTRSRTFSRLQRRPEVSWSIACPDNASQTRRQLCSTSRIADGKCT